MLRCQLIERIQTECTARTDDRFFHGLAGRVLHREVGAEIDIERRAGVRRFMRRFGARKRVFVDLRRLLLRCHALCFLPRRTFCFDPQLTLRIAHRALLGAHRRVLTQAVLGARRALGEEIVDVSRRAPRQEHHADDHKNHQKDVCAGAAAQRQQRPSEQSREHAAPEPPRHSPRGKQRGNSRGEVVAGHVRFGKYEERARHKRHQKRALRHRAVDRPPHGDKRGRIQHERPEKVRGDAEQAEQDICPDPRPALRAGHISKGEHRDARAEE